MLKFLVINSLFISIIEWIEIGCLKIECHGRVEYFINFALEHCPNQSGICCPCMQCGNLIHHTPNKIREHTFFNGIDQSYHTWYWHGEAGPTSRQPTEMAQCYVIRMPSWCMSY